MSPEEHLNRIVAKCRELLAIAEKRTPGEWMRDRSGGLKGDVRCKSGRWIAMTAFCGNSNAGGLIHQDANAAFIASCAGPAEAGWRATIAAIEGRKNCPSCGGCGITDGWVPSYSNPDNSGGHPEAAPCCTHLKDIIAAWPEELL